MKLKDGISPAVGAILTRQRDRLLRDLEELERDCFDKEPTLAGAKLEAVDPNHRADLAYILDTLCEVRPVLKNEPLRERVTAAINGMTYIIDRTRRAARGVQRTEGGSDARS